MQKNFILGLCSVMLLLCVTTADAQKLSAASGPRYAEGVVRVKLQPELATLLQKATLPDGTVRKKARAQYVTTGATTLDRVAQRVKAVSMKRVFPYAGKDEARHKAAGLDRWYDITYAADGMTPAQARNLYTSTAGVEYAQRVPVYQPYGGESFKPASATDVTWAQRAMGTLPFDDPFLAKQWHYHNDGSIDGTLAGYDINVFPAWESGVTGSKDVIVAIVDGGFQIDHPDLKDNVWVNEAELKGQPGVDDDGDGFVDDIYGYNFVVGSANINAHSHGTHVAGTVGATNNNGIGVAGVAGGSDGTGGVKMMVCQVFDSRASDQAVADFAGALVYAADRGASIAQCSWGMSVADEEDKATTEAVKYFTKYGGGDKMKGGLCIFAAGNNGEEGNYYPGCLPDVVAVGAMNGDGTASTYSNYGSWVDVTAPGGQEDYGEQLGVLSTLPNGQYGYNEGTSMACPHVSGIAALILSKYGNKNFSNETLRTLLTSSVNDFYSKNPTYAGKMGSGYIDAYKALQGQEGTVPDAVSDFTLTPSHDNILVEWTIPASGTEGVIDHHVIYYSTSPITDDTKLESLSSVSVDTKFLSSGDKTSYELTGVSANTTYYICMVAYNRWGKASARSAVKSATTNAGPMAKVDKSSVTMTVDASKASTAKGEFTISNTREGVLKYQLQSATQALTPSYSTSSVEKQQVAPGKVAPFSGHMAMENAANHEIVSSGYKATAYPDTLTYASKIYAFIGENDTELPNALAQRLTVNAKTHPNGFNITDLRFGGAYGTNPVIEIYDGSRSISTATLLATVDYKSQDVKWGYNTDIPLNEQIYVAPGKSIWVVAKFPAGQSKPLGLAYSRQDSVFTQSFASFDNGATWTQLDQALKGSTYAAKVAGLTWSVYALSKNPDWSAVLNPDPVSGEVRAGESQKVTLKNDGQQLPNGNYIFNLHLKTNEATKTDNQVKVSMTVKGYKPSITSQKMIDFGNVLVGEEKTLSVELTNSGFGAFAATRYGTPFYSYTKTLTVSSDQFKVTSCPRIAARSNGTMDVTFKPTKGGDFTGTVTLKDQGGLTYSFTVRGSATEPAKLVVTPDTAMNIGNLEVGGAEKTQVFTIKNDGKYPLQYVFPKFSSKTIEGTSGLAHRFGYTLESSFDGQSGLVYEPMPELSDEKDITDKFTDEYSWQSDPVSIGFKFPFYDKEFDQLYICSIGGLSFGSVNGKTIGCSVPSADCVKGLGGYISAAGFVGPSVITGPDSKISYGHREGKLYVNFQNVLTYDSEGQGGTTPVSFHMVLTPDGSTTIYYDLYDPSKLRDNGTQTYIGVVDPDAKDPYTVIDSDHDPDETLLGNLQTGCVLKLTAPARQMIKSVSSADGYLGIGEQKDITATFAAGNDLNAGALTNNLVLNTNDPQKASVNVVFKANIIGDLKPQAVLSADTLNFGDVYRTSTQKRTLNLKNEGRDTLKVAGVSVNEEKFAIDDAVKSAFAVVAGNTKDIDVQLNTENSGDVVDTMVIAFADGTKKNVVLKAHVGGCPQVAVTPDNIEEETAYGTDVRKTLSFANNGDEKMSFAITNDTWFKFDSLLADNKTSQVGYTYKSKVYDTSVSYDWIDITGDDEDGVEHMPAEYFNDKTDYKEVELPFEFPFYGKKYKKMYIYDTGFVSFTKPSVDYKMFPPPPEEGLPSTESFYNNLIAPYWGNHTPDPASTCGVFYKSFGDYVVVSYKNYGNSVMDGMNFQVILRKDGTFKFQYKLDPDGIFVSAFGVCGVMDETGTRAVSPYSEQNIKSGNAIEFAPYMSYVVAPGTSTDVPVTIDGHRIADVYQNAFKVTTNVPNKEQFEIPVALNITGEVKAEFPDSISYTAVYNDGTPATIEFEVKNNGTKAFQIVDANSSIFQWDDNFGREYGSLQYYDPNPSSDEGGIDPGPLSLQDDFGEGDGSGWKLYTPGMNAPISVGFEPVKFRLVYNYTDTPNDTFTVAKNPDSQILFTLMNVVDGETSEQAVPVNIHITEAPHMTFDKESIWLKNVPADYTGSETLNIKNDGAYKLHYSLRLDPTGNDEAVEDESNGDGGDTGLLSVMAPAMTKAQAKAAIEEMAQPVTFNVLAKAMKHYAKVKDNQKYVYDVPTDIDYTNILYHPVKDPISNARAAFMGTGDKALDQNFIAATRYEAPAEGFNLSHIYFVGTTGDLTNVDIEATVVQGSKVNAKNRNIGHGKLHITEPNTDQEKTYGKPMLLQLDKPVFINPNDTFYVVLKYPAGYGQSAMMASKQGELTPNRYMCNLESLGGWVDIEDMYDQYYSYGAFGYFMTCLETEKGQPWVKLLNADTDGELAVGEDLAVNFGIDAKQSYFTKNNKATLVIHSDDPTQKVVNYHIYLDKNGAPQITVPTSVVATNQGDDTKVAISASEPEGEAFTLSYVDAKGYTSVASYNEADGVTLADGVFSVPAGKQLKATLQVHPEYGYDKVGNGLIALTATDASGNAATASVNYSVVFANRAPEYVGQDELTYAEGQQSGIISFSTLFSDPDGDDFTCTAVSSDAKVASVFVSEDGLIVNAKKEGTAVLTLTATDTNKGVTSHAVTVNVKTSTGIAGVYGDKGDITIDTDNNGSIGVVVNGNVAEAVLRLYNNAGQLVAEKTARNLRTGDKVTLAVSVSAGVYHLNATLDGKVSNVKFAVK